MEPSSSWGGKINQVSRQADICVILNCVKEKKIYEKESRQRVARYICLHERRVGNRYTFSGRTLEDLLRRGQLCLDVKEEV